MVFDFKFWNRIRNVIKLYHLNFLFDTIGADYLSEDEMELVNSGYTAKFKVVEVYEKIKSKLS